MADGFEFKMDTKELDDWLSTLPEKFQGRVAKNALQAAGDVMLESMKAHCPSATVAPSTGSTALQPGVLQESLTTQVQMGKKYAPRVKVGAPSETSHVAYWIEEGFDHYTGGRKGYGGKQGKHIEGKHFMAAAFDETAERAIDVMIDNLAAAMHDKTGSTAQEG